MSEMTTLEIIAEMDRVEAKANRIMTGYISPFDQDLACELAAQYHELAAEIVTRTGIDIRPTC